MKRWLALLGCVLGVTACSDHSQPAAPAAGADLLGDVGGGLIPQLSGVVLVVPRFAAGPESPGPSWPGTPGSNVVMNQDQGTRPQNETPISVDPNDERRLFGGANDYRVFDTQCGVYASSNGGASWNDVGTGTTLPPFATVAGDPSTAFGPDGAAYSVCIGFTRTANGNSSIYISRSTDLTTIQFRGFVILDLLGGTDVTFAYFNDKAFVAVDTRPGSPHYGRIYVTWTRFKTVRTTGAFVEAPIVLKYSDDGGATWSSQKAVSPAALNRDQGSVPYVGPNGEVYVVYENFQGAAAPFTQALVSTSLDGGNTFSATVKVDDVFQIPFPLENSLYRGNSFPSIAGCMSGNLYVVWGDYREGNADARFSRSTDGGVTWEPSFVVNSDASTADQFFPWITAVQDNGVVEVAFVQRDDTPGNRLINTYLSTSFDLGASFEPQILVTDGPSDPNNDGFAGAFIGDYIGVAGKGTAAHPAWTDTRGLGCRNQVVCSPNADAVTATVTFE
jgi:hypothetical protein